MAKKSSKTTKAATIAAYTVFCLTSPASAFHSAPTRQLTTINGPIHPSPSRSSSQTSIRSFSQSRSRASTTSFLEYANDSAEATETTTGQWWKNVFKPKELDEQDSVDEYLEFLDRRYNRLHSTNEDDEAKPLSAIGWLLNGTPKRNDVIAAAHQDEDSLYVLGVAGLASERLLQKHHIVAPSSSPSGGQAPNETSTAIDVNAESGVEDTASAKFIKKVLVPVIRKYVIFQRAKDVFVNKQIVRVQAFTVASLRIVLRSLIQGPIMTTKAVLHIGGGKKSIAMTITAVTTVLLLLRPVLQAVISETTGSVAP